jgi:hypothetical protein
MSGIYIGSGGKSRVKKKGELEFSGRMFFYLFSGRIYIKQANGKKLHFGLSQYKIPAS